MRRRSLAIVALFPLVVMAGIVALRPGAKVKRLPERIAGPVAMAEQSEVRVREEQPVPTSKSGSLQQMYVREGVRLSGGWGELRLSLKDIRIGDRLLAQGLSVEPEKERNEVRYHRGAVVEKYVAGVNGVEQIFELDSSVAPYVSQGDLRIRVALDTPLNAVQRGNTLLFRDSGGSTVLTYGAATAIDAAGRRESLTYALEHNELTMVLGGRFLSTALFPLVVDPLIGTNFAIDNSVWEDMDPDVAYSGDNRYLVVYHEKNTDITTKGDVVCRLASTAGEELDVKYAEESAVDSRGPKVASGNGNNFLVVWEQTGTLSYSEIWGRFLTCSSTTNVLTLAGSAFKIAGELLYNLRRPDVGFSESTGRFLVAWERETAASNRDIFARTVSSATSLGILIPITQDTGNDDLRLTVSPRSANDRMGVVWVRRKVGDTKGDLWGCSVSVAGSVAYFSPASITLDALNDDFPHLGGTLPDDCFLTWSRDKGVNQWMTVAQKVKFTSMDPGLLKETYFEIDNTGTNTTLGTHCDAGTLAGFKRAVFVFNYNSGSSSTGMDIYAAVYDTSSNPPQRVEPAALNDWLKVSVGVGNQSSSTVALNRFDLTALVTFDYINKDIIGQRVQLAPHTVSPPSTPSGPTLGATGPSYGYSTGGSTCNLGHAMTYRFDWGDGTLSSFGASPLSHAWSQDGTHFVKAQARCEAGEYSAWSTSGLSVKIYYPPEITSPSSPLPAGVVGVAATATQFQATGTQPITWSISSGTPPLGMTLTSQGIYSGTPTVAGTYTFTVEAENPGAPTTKSYTHQIVAPVIAVSPNALSFTLPEGSGLSSQTLAISNGGGGTLNWSQVVSSSAPTPWLTATPSSGTNSGTVTVSVTPSGLQPGSYSASIILTAADASNSPQSVPVTVMITAVPPTMTGPGSLAQGTVGSSFSTTLTAGGSAPIVWSIASGSLPPGMTLTSAGFYSGTPTAAGSYDFSVKASNSAGSSIKPYTHEINPMPVAGPLTVTPSSGFSSSGAVGASSFSPDGKTYAIKNPGTAVMAWDSSISVSWLKVSPSHGNVPKEDSVDVTVSIGSSAQNLGAGVHTGAVTFLAGNEQVTRMVYLTVGTAEMTVTDAEGFSSSGNPAVGFSPPSKQYEVKNSGTAPMSWEATTPAAWLKLTNTGGTLNPSEVSMVTVEVVAPPTGLAVGTYVSSVAFTNKTNSAGNATRAVNLTVGSTAGPLMVTPGGSSSFGGLIGGPFNPLSVTYTVGNAGLTPIAWNASADQPWVNLSPTSGTLLGGQNEAVTITLTAAAQALVADNHSAILTFTNTTNGIGNATRQVKISVGGLSVGPGEGLSASGPQGGPFDPATTTYVLTNNGTTVITWTASAIQSWIALSQTQGTLPPQGTASVTVSLNGAAGTLAGGTYSDVIKFKNTTNGIGDTERKVDLAVSPPPPAIAGQSEGGGGGGGGCGLVGLEVILSLGLLGLLRRRRHAGRKAHFMEL